MDPPKTIRIQVKTIFDGEDLSDGYWAYDEPTEVELELDTASDSGDGDSKSPADNVPGWLDQIVDFTQTTSLHGWHYITEENTYMVRRIFWFLLVASAFGLYIYYVYDRIVFFFDYQKTVNVEINYPAKMPFPAITFCNQNQYKITALAENDWYNIITSVMVNTTADTTTNATCPVNEFPCHSGGCIPSSQRCDLFPDCSDGSDEGSDSCRAFDYSCPLLKVTSETPYAKGNLSSVIDFDFAIQRFTFSTEIFQNRNRPFYVRENTDEDVYLYYDSEISGWVFGGIFEGKPYLASTVNPVYNPNEIGTEWTIHSDTPMNATLLITCGARYLTVLQRPTIPSADGITMEELMHAASHKKEDFILRCTWKNENCAETAITESLTDMGICYKFYDLNDMDIEQSGPGFGLTMILNVEYYEYSNIGDSGIGIKILMHDNQNVALVQERGTAVSPGLYSYMSAETTTVTSVEPPYGQCGEETLLHYTYYSLATCQMECQTELLYKRCGCIEAYQPALEPFYQVCNLSDFVDCARPYLDAIRTNSSLCNTNVCKTPCVETSYVPTTSFATVFGNPLGTAIESIQTNLLFNIENATETAQREVRDKIKRTYRLFHDVSTALLSMQRWSNLAINNMRDEQNKVINVGARLTSDCATFRDALVAARDNITAYLELPLAIFISAFEMKVFTRFVEFYNDINETLQQYDAIQNINDRMLYQSVHNQTIWHAWHDIHASLTLMSVEEMGFVLGGIQNLSSDNPILFDKILLEPLLPYIGKPCEQCMNNDKQRLISLLKQNVEDTIKIEPILVLFEGNFLQFFNSYIRVIDKLFTADPRNDVYNSLNDLMDMLKTTHNMLTDGQVSLKGSQQFVLDTLGYIWRLRCQAGTERVFDVYKSDYTEVDGLLDETYDFTKTQIEVWTSNNEAYFGRKKTLAEVGKTFKFDEIKSFLSRKETRLETSLNRIKQSIGGIHSHVSQIGYLLYSCLDTSWLAEHSALWEKFEAVIPTLSNTEEVVVRTSDGYLVPNPDLTILLSEMETEFWTLVQENLDSNVKNLELQMVNFTSFITVSETYMNSYLLSLQLTDTFFTQNFLQVELFFKELTQQNVTQSPAYTPENLLSEIGGFMGLLLGASVISLAEFFDCVFYYLARKGHQRCKQRQADAEPDPETEVAMTNDDKSWPKNGGSTHWAEENGETVWSKDEY